MPAKGYEKTQSFSKGFYQNNIRTKLGQCNIRKSIQKILTEQTPEFITTFTKFRTRHIILSLLIIIAAANLAACGYQIADRLFYYLSTPTIVDAHISEKNKGLFPRVVLYPGSTQELTNYVEEVAEMAKKYNIEIDNSNCADVLKDKYLQQLLEFYKTIDLWSTQSYITDAYLAMGHVRVNLTVKNQDSLAQPATQVYIDDLVTFGNPSYHTVIKLNMPENCWAIRVTLSTNEEPFYEYPLAGVFLQWYKKTKIIASLQEYHLLNTRKQPCKNDEHECLMGCITGFMKLLKLNCSIPLYWARSLPRCKNNMEPVITYAFIRRMHIIDNLLQTCGCPGKCDMTLLHAIYDTVNEDSATIHVYLESRDIRVIEERYAYDLISLMCDVGGIIGLYFGFSCLVIAEIILHVGKFVIGKFFNKEAKTSQREKQLKTKLTKLLGVIKSREEEKNSQKIWRFKTQKSRYFFIAAGILTLISAYQIYSRIILYFNYPTFITIRIIRDEHIQMPTIVTCRDSFITTRAKKMIARDLNTSCDNVHFYDILDPPSKLAGKTELIWYASATAEEHLKAQSHPSFHSIRDLLGNISVVQSVFGICTAFSMTERKYFPHKNAMYVTYNLNEIDNYMCGWQHKNFIIPPNHLFHPKYIFYLKNHFFSKIYISRQTYIRVNTPKEPCQQTNLAIKCEQNCYLEKIKEMKFKCRLPFTSSKVPLCKDSQSVRETANIFLRSQFNTNPRKSCSCYSCEETIFIPRIVNENNATTIEGGASYEIPSNIREVIQQEIMFSGVKLFCDIGSLVGVLIGLSVFSFVQMFLPM